MDTCLFTDEQLTAETKWEHTLPAKLGGRIKSKRVSSSAFNQRCGSTIDRDLADAYWQIMMVLAPVLASEHQPGNREVQFPGDKGKYYIDGKGVLNPKGIEILSRDPTTNRPTGAAALDREAAERILKQNLLPDESIDWSYMPNPKGRAKLPRCQFPSPHIELALLKAGLLTFDELLHAVSDRFTRSKYLQSLRDTLRHIILTDVDPASFLAEISLGIQYEKLDLFQEIREQIKFPRSTHEHLMIASAHPPSRTLDLIVLLFDTDPYGFRLSMNWQGDGFTYAFVNGVLRDTGHSGLIKLPQTYLLCRSTMRRWAYPTKRSQKGMEITIQEILDNQAAAIHRANYYVLMKADDYVRKTLYNTALPSWDKGKYMRDVTRECLITQYEGRLENKTTMSRFDRLVAVRLQDLSKSTRDEFVEKESDLDHISWDLWILLFRKIVRDLCPVIGWPGDFEFGTSDIP